MMFKVIINYLKGLGLIETILAFYLIMAGYSYGSIHMSLVVLVLLSFFSLFKKKINNIGIRPLLVFLLFFVFHESIFLFITGAPSYHINSDISILIYIISVFFIAPIINYKKFEDALILVGLICAVGLVYTYVQIYTTGISHPLKLPFLPTPSQTSRLFEDVTRPTSFFGEPSAYVDFMMIPAFITLYKRKNILLFIFVFTILLSGSTTGIILFVIIFASYIFTSRQSVNNKLLILIIGCIIAYILFNSIVFEVGVEKIQETDFGSNSRTANGLILASNLNIWDFFLGYKYANAADFVYAKGLEAQFFAVQERGDIYISTFWLVLCQLGVVGLFLYLSIYYKLWKNNKELLPYIITILVNMFSQPTYLGATFAFQIIFMTTFSSFYNRQKMHVLATSH